MVKGMVILAFLALLVLLVQVTDLLISKSSAIESPAVIIHLWICIYIVYVYILPCKAIKRPLLLKQRPTATGALTLWLRIFGWVRIAVSRKLRLCVPSCGYRQFEHWIIRYHWTRQWWTFTAPFQVEIWVAIFKIKSSNNATLKKNTSHLRELPMKL